MTTPTLKPLTTQKIWAQLMFNMGIVNLQRARDARRFDNHLRNLLRRY